MLRPARGKLLEPPPDVPGLGPGAGPRLAWILWGVRELAHRLEGGWPGTRGFQGHPEATEVLTCVSLSLKLQALCTLNTALRELRPPFPAAIRIGPWIRVFCHSRLALAQPLTPE